MEVVLQSLGVHCNGCGHLSRLLILALYFFCKGFCRVVKSMYICLVGEFWGWDGLGWFGMGRDG